MDKGLAKELFKSDINSTISKEGTDTITPENFEEEFERLKELIPKSLEVNLPNRKPLIPRGSRESIREGLGIIVEE